MAVGWRSCLCRIGRIDLQYTEQHAQNMTLEARCQKRLFLHRGGGVRQLHVHLHCIILYVATSSDLLSIDLGPAVWSKINKREISQLAEKTLSAHFFIRTQYTHVQISFTTAKVQSAGIFLGVGSKGTLLLSNCGIDTDRHNNIHHVSWSTAVKLCWCRHVSSVFFLLPIGPRENEIEIGQVYPTSNFEIWHFSGTFPHLPLFYLEQPLSVNSYLGGGGNWGEWGDFTLDGCSK